MYLESVAAAFVRGATGKEGTDQELIKAGREQGLKMHRFKVVELPRVTRCVGTLHGLAPESLLDVGSGRGVFLWTLLSQMPQLPITCLDILDHRVELINTVSKGGYPDLQARQLDVRETGFEDDQFDVATALEVLEHLPDPGRAVRELVRMTRRYLLISVPSKPDNNPEHIQCFEAKDLERLLLDNGVREVQLSHVLNHRIALGKLS